MGRLNDQIIVMQEQDHPTLWRAWMEHQQESTSLGATPEIAVGSLVMNVTAYYGEFVVTRVEVVEDCECSAPMVFKGAVKLLDGNEAHEYDMCDLCSAHVCRDCSKYIAEIPHCEPCYAEIME